MSDLAQSRKWAKVLARAVDKWAADSAHFRAIAQRDKGGMINAEGALRQLGR